MDKQEELEVASLEIIEKMMMVLIESNEIELARAFSDQLMDFAIDNNPSAAIKSIAKRYLKHEE